MENSDDIVSCIWLDGAAFNETQYLTIYKSRNTVRLTTGRLKNKSWNDFVKFWWKIIFFPTFYRLMIHGCVSCGRGRGRGRPGVCHQEQIIICNQRRKVRLCEVARMALCGEPNGSTCMEHTKIPMETWFMAAQYDAPLVGQKQTVCVA